LRSGRAENSSSGETGLEASRELCAPEARESRRRRGRRRDGGGWVYIARAMAPPVGNSSRG